MRTSVVLRLLACVSLAAGCARGGSATLETTAAPQAAAVPAVPENAARHARSALYEVFVRSFSPEGNFRGVMDGLDRIQGVGAEVVWLMPIHPVGEERRKGPLGSPYAVRDYRGLNPAFGSEADFRALIDAVHGRGMKLILDWVPNHTAWDHPWVSRHPDFYTRNEAGEMTHPRDEQGNLTDWTDVVELDYDNPGMRRAMIAEMRYWLEEWGVDGFRVDVAGMVPDAFWREAIPELRAAGATVLLAEWGDPRMHRLGFDLTYAWDSYSRLKEVWRGGAASAFVERELAELQDMPADGLRMRFTTNHDETAWDEPPVILFGGVEGARAAFVAMALLPGPPLIYNGQEVESPQKLPLFEDERVDWNRPGADAARAFYRHVIELGRTHSGLSVGGLQAVQTDAADDVIAYRRDNAVVLVNARPRPVRVAVHGVELNGARELLNGGDQRGNTVALAAHGAVVLELVR